MRSLLSLALALLPTVAAAQGPSSQLRHLSHAVRDTLPAVSEAKALYDAPDQDAVLGNFVEQWMATPAHENRVRRYFSDRFGVEPNLFISDSATDLILNDGNDAEKPDDLAATGVWHLPKSVKPSCGGAPLTRDAWWTDTPIQICPSAVSTAIKFGTWPNMQNCIDPGSANGIRHALCGCGPQEIICHPRNLKAHIMAVVSREMVDRGLYAYQQGWSWLKLYGGDTFYGDRFLYQHYLYQQKFAPTLENPTSDELATIHSLPTGDAAKEAPYPEAIAERSGVVTAPGFMRRFNNFRSRIRAITERLLCQDVDASLNQPYVDHFVNPTLLGDPFNAQHGTKQGCSDCHYSMDNFGSTILGWNDSGFFEAWNPPSQLGHVFGVDDTGPRFLMASYIERASGFHECMAKTAWTDFSGVAWEDLAPDQRASFTALAAEGPRALIQGVLKSPELRDVRAGKVVTTTQTVEVILDFDHDINPILQAKCANAGCHGAAGAASTSLTFVGQSARFKSAPAIRLSTGSMPPPNSGLTLTDAEKNALLLWLAQ